MEKAFISIGRKVEWELSILISMCCMSSSDNKFSKASAFSRVALPDMKQLLSSLYECGFKRSTLLNNILASRIPYSLLSVAKLVPEFHFAHIRLYLFYDPSIILERNTRLILFSVLKEYQYVR